MFTGMAIVIFAMSAGGNQNARDEAAPLKDES